MSLPILFTEIVRKELVLWARLPHVAYQDPPHPLLPCFVSSQDLPPSFFARRAQRFPPSLFARRAQRSPPPPLAATAGAVPGHSVCNFGSFCFRLVIHKVCLFFELVFFGIFVLFGVSYVLFVVLRSNTKTLRKTKIMSHRPLDGGGGARAVCLHLCLLGFLCSFVLFLSCCCFSFQKPNNLTESQHYEPPLVKAMRNVCNHCWRYSAVFCSLSLSFSFIMFATLFRATVNRSNEECV